MISIISRSPFSVPILYMFYTFNFFVETEGHLKVRDSLVHCKGCYISETTTDGKWYEAYHIASSYISYDLSDLQSYSLILQGFSNAIFR